MARYAFDEELRVLVVIWGTGTGDAARRLAELPAEVPRDGARRLVQAMTLLSETLWRTYTHPPGAVDSLEVNSEGWRREEERKRLPSVPAILREPNLPGPGGMMTVSYIPVEEAAHRVGRVLHRIASAELTEVVVAEVETELEAIGNAELGNLTGRAVHAVTLTRAGASPAQVAAADKVLHDDPLGGDALFTELDPAASAVAAAHWLKAAADVAAEASGLEPTEIVIEADNIQALAHATPTAMLELLDAGASPYQAVVDMISDAMQVAEGYVPDLDDLQSQIAELEELAQRHGGEDSGLRDSLLAELRITPLDPARPAQDLLEDLLTGIYACWLIYQEYADSEPEADDSEESPISEFVDAVRIEADLYADCLE